MLAFTTFKEPMQDTILYSSELLSKYNTQAPRYTSYPTAVEFSACGNELDIHRAARQSINTQMSLYIHIPFCQNLCYYCGCNKLVTRHTHKADEYLTYLAQEAHQFSSVFADYEVTQVHLGGGTPNFLNQSQMTRLVALLRSNFNFSEQLEMGIELDPRHVENGYLATLSELGFNRLSMGVQDVNTDVQQAINREQDCDTIIELMQQARAQGFASINLDVIYGLPLQHADNFKNSIDFVLNADPDRISLFSYAHLPQRFAAQRKIKQQWLPLPNEKFELMQQAIAAFGNGGYEMIGLDHFAKPSDDLAKAKNQGELHRNFQGYTTHGDCDLLGLGVSAISSVGNLLCQNHKSLGQYYEALNHNNTSIARGVLLDEDDRLRAYVIKELMCNLYVDKYAVNELFEIDFDRYFAEEATRLKTFADDGLLSQDEQCIQVKPTARLFIRNICMQFDAYIQRQQKILTFSQAI